MAGILLGPVSWDVTLTSMGHRNYLIQWLVQSTDKYNDGPQTIAQTPGLPPIGNPWIFGNDNDIWALCWPDWKISPVLTHEPNDLWTVEQHFSTEPIIRCQDTQIENPLAEPFKINGGFIKRTKMARVDMNGNPVTNSAQQPYNGPENEWDDNRPTLQIGWNRVLNPGPTSTAFIDTVNDSYLWGYPPRTIKLCNVSFTRNLWGVCNFYFTTTYEFELQYDPLEINPITGNALGWDRLFPDRGNRVLSGYSPGYWEVAGGPNCPSGTPNQPKTNSSPTNPLTGKPWACGDLVQPNNQISPLDVDSTTGTYKYLNPANYVAYKMAQDGEPTEVYLDGYGRPVGSINQAKLLLVQKYPQNNMFLLGIPYSLDINLFPTF